MLFALFCAIAPATIAQVKVSATGKVAASPTPTPIALIEDAETLSVDFQNFKYQDLGAKTVSTFDLVNGLFTSFDKKTKITRSYQFRKKFYFDVTGDGKSEAVIHLLADACEFCQDRSVFYAFSAVEKQPNAVFGIATGSGARCGLKEIQFLSKQVVIDVFGDCKLVNGRLVSEAASKKVDIFSRFTLGWNESDPKMKGFAEATKETLPFPAKDIPAHRPQIKFGKQE
ncbi:MAG: hypothetical protein IPN69_11990 [Acidobacteria bacterium]|nr:hypothetical protein [Acidobacteriota bacterium]